MVSVSGVSFGANYMAPAKTCSRNLLRSARSQIKPLAGPKEIKQANVIVGISVAENAAIAASMAQLPGWDEVALSANEVKMAMEIFNGVYNFKLSKTIVGSILAGLAGNKIGTTVFKWASKSITWIPGFGNSLNAGVASSTTLALGAAIVNMAEEMDKARKRGESIDRFIKEMEK